jgi:hypothetical protein
VGGNWELGIGNWELEGEDSIDGFMSMRRVIRVGILYLRPLRERGTWKVEAWLGQGVRRMEWSMRG